MYIYIYKKHIIIYIYIYDEDFSQLYDKCVARSARQLYLYTFFNLHDLLSYIFILLKVIVVVYF